MQKYVARRLLLFIPTLLGASLIIFTVMRILPGDVALSIVAGDEVSASSLRAVEGIRKELGLNDHLAVQYAKWMWSMVNGEFGGQSIFDREPLSEIVLRRLPPTIQLTILTIIVSWFISVPFGVAAAVFQNHMPDYSVRVMAVLGHSLPNFWVGLMVILGLLLVFRWTPPLYYFNIWEDPLAHLQKTIWPALILSWGYSASLTRITRSSLLEVLRQDYVRTARSKGLTERVVVIRHALRNALIPVVTIGGLQLAGLISGTVILEAIFGIPGIGQGIVNAATLRDYPVIQSLTVLVVLFMVALNLLVDIFYAFVDPRIRYS